MEPSQLGHGGAHQQCKQFTRFWIQWLIIQHTLQRCFSLRPSLLLLASLAPLLPACSLLLLLLLLDAGVVVPSPPLLCSAITEDTAAVASASGCTPCCLRASIFACWSFDAACTAPGVDSMAPKPATSMAAAVTAGDELAMGASSEATEHCMGAVVVPLPIARSAMLCCALLAWCPCIAQHGSMRPHARADRAEGHATELLCRTWVTCNDVKTTFCAVETLCGHAAAGRQWRES